MSVSSEPDLLRRLIEFELSLEHDSSERVEELEWGRLILNPPTRALWSDNYLELDSAAFEAADLAALADRLLEARGIEHRYVVSVDPALSARLEPGFRELGWEIPRSLYMTLDREPDREAGEAVEVPRSRVEGIRRAVAED